MHIDTLLITVALWFTETLNQANISWQSVLKSSGLKCNSGLDLQRLALYPEYRGLDKISAQGKIKKLIIYIHLVTELAQWKTKNIFPPDCWFISGILSANQLVDWCPCKQNLDATDQACENVNTDTRPRILWPYQNSKTFSYTSKCENLLDNPTTLKLRIKRLRLF